MPKPGPKPKRLAGVQLEAFDLSEMRGQGPSFFTSVDRLAVRSELEVSVTTELLSEMGWALSPSVQWVAHSRTRNRTVRAASSRGLLRAVYRVEAGGEVEQAQLPLGELHPALQLN